MDPPRPLPDKSNKKVSRACNTCRMKRKKCNGLDPCLFCTENRVECSYSREPRRRGPPSGYLRYTETRVALFEILLGLFISHMYPDSDREATIDPFYEVAQTLMAESKICTQDVWDGHRRVWTVRQSAKVIDKLAITLAPYSQRPDQEVASKPLLPPVLPNVGASADASVGASSDVRTPETPISPLPPPTPPPRGHSASGIIVVPSSVAWTPLPADSSSDRGGIDYSPSATHTLSRESFERRTIPLHPISTPLSTETASWQYSRLEIPTADEYNVSSESNKASDSAYPLDSALDAERFEAAEQEHRLILSSPVARNPTISQFGDQDTNYAGSYWRSVDLAMPDSPDYPFAPHPDIPSLSSPIFLELPPPHILSKIIDVYYNNVWPTFPFFPTRPTLESLLSSVAVKSETFSTVLLALCAYCSRLSPSSEDILGSGEAGKVAADLWYEQARSGVFTCIRKGSSVEIAQALLLLALNDHGKGNETQAWIFVGMAVRVGQDMDFQGDLPTTYTKKRFPVEEIRLRRNIWSVSLMLDLFLSLQLGRPPASFDCLRSAAASITPENEYTNHPVPIFLHAVALCRTIARINLHLYLGYDTPEMQSQTEKLNMLKDELENWYQLLPAQFRFVVGHQASRPVLELNMLYHVAVILLYRPFCRENDIQHATDTLAEAASAFNGLLVKYRQIQSDESMASSSSPLSLSNPNMIYIIFTAAIAHLSGYKMRHSPPGMQEARSTVMALQTQLHLSNCLEALTSIGVTWGLARRCWKTLHKLMEVEGLKLQRSTTSSDLTQPNLGKRKREGDDVTGDARRPFRGGPREPLPGAHISTNMTQPAFCPTLGNAKSMITSTPLPQNATETDPAAWGVVSTTSPFKTLSMPPPALPSELFSSTELSSARWLSETQENDSIGLGIVWNGEWDEQLWTRTMNTSLNANG